MIQKITRPFIFTLFGASGDLAKVKIFPALYQLAAQKRLPKEYYIVGFSRTKKDRVIFQNEFAESVSKKEGQYLNNEILKELLNHVYYLPGQYTEEESFCQYAEFIKKFVRKKILHIAYYSVPPTVYGHITKNLSLHCTKRMFDTRLIIEKPFGHDRTSAEDLYHTVLQYFEEDQVYLLDHYLGKSSVQSIYELRRANRMLNLMLRGPEIANIQISAFEDIGIGQRVGYFDNTGIIKDMVQSHLLQTLALVCMSIPLTESAESIHRERLSILSAITAPRNKQDVLIGQYTGYKKERGVPKSSRTETFVGLRLSIDRDDWHNVPIYLRTGKRLHEKHTFVVVEFEKFSYQDPKQQPDRLIIEIQPQPRVHIQLVNRLDSASRYQTITTSESIACDIEGCLPDHASLMLDAITGKRVHFLSFPEVLETWRVTDSVLDTITQSHAPLKTYTDGSFGPVAQHGLTKRDSFRWYDLPH